MKSGETVRWSMVNPHLEQGPDYIEVWQDGGVADHFGLLKLCPVADLRPCKAGATPLLVDRMAYRRWRGMEYGVGKESDAGGQGFRASRHTLDPLVRPSGSGGAE